MINQSLQPISKAVLMFTFGLDSPRRMSLLDIVQGVWFDYLQENLGITLDWYAFTHRCQVNEREGAVKLQTAYMPQQLYRAVCTDTRAKTILGESIDLSQTTDPSATVAWALSVRLHDPAVKRRNWSIQASLQMLSPSRLKLFYAVSYYDHYAGSFHALRPPMLPIPDPMDALLAQDNLCCLCGRFPLPLAPVELNHSTFPRFWDMLRDEQRNLPIVLMTCFDWAHPEEVHAIVRGNAVVYWCDDASVLTHLNALLSEELRVGQGCMRVFFRLNSGIHHPLFTADDVERMGGEEKILYGLYQAYCQDFRSEDRRAFLTVNDLYELYNLSTQANLRDQVNLGKAENEKLHQWIAEMTDQQSELREQCAQMTQKVAAVDSDACEALRSQFKAETEAYEALLNESMTENDALKSAISAITLQLYTDMGKGFRPDTTITIEPIQALSEAIYRCLARSTFRS
jgi:hypothetical protein